MPSSSSFSLLSLHDALPIWFNWSARIFKNHGCNGGNGGRLLDGCLQSQRDFTGFFGVVPAGIICSGGTSRAGEKPGKVALRLKRSEEHTSELQSRLHLVCRLLLVFPFFPYTTLFRSGLTGPRGYSKITGATGEMAAGCLTVAFSRNATLPGFSAWFRRESFVREEHPGPGKNPVKSRCD